MDVGLWPTCALSRVSFMGSTPNKARHLNWPTFTPANGPFLRRDCENGADTHVPADLDRTVDDLDLDKHRHIHCHCCPEVETTVHFSGKELNRKFSPATTIEVATRWSRMNLRLDAAAASEFVLQLSGTMEQPRPSQHLGELVQGGECTLSFELVKEMTPQG